MYTSRHRYMTSQSAAISGTSTAANPAPSAAGEPLLGPVFTPATGPIAPGLGYAATSGAIGFPYAAMSFNEAPIYQHPNHNMAALQVSEGFPPLSHFAPPTNPVTTNAAATHDPVAKHALRPGSAHTHTSRSLRDLSPSPSSSRIFASSGVKTISDIDSPRAATPYDRPQNPSPQVTLPKQFIEDTKAHLGIHFITKAHPLTDQSAKNKACNEAFTQAKHYWPAYCEVLFIFIVFC